MINSPSHAKRSATGNPEPISKSPRQGSSTLPTIDGEDSDEEAKLDREMTIEGAKLPPHSSPNDDAMLIEEADEIPTEMEVLPQQPNTNPPPPPVGGGHHHP